MRGFRRSASMRFRATAGATVVVALALLAGSAGFVALLDGSLTETVELAAEQQLEGIASGLERSGRPELPEDVEGVALLSRDGEVVSQSDGDGDGDDPPRVPDAGDTTIRIDGEKHVLVRDEVEIAGEEYDLVVARSLEEVDDAVSTTTWLLALAAPVLAMLVAATTWIVVGRALAPVERIRAEVDRIGSDDLERRVPEPASGDEIARLAGTMNGMLDRLEAAQRAQRRFVSDAAHELRSPLASMRQFAEVAYAHPERVPGRELADAVLEEGERLQQLVDGLLLLSRLDERGRALPTGAVDLDDLVLAEVERSRTDQRVRVDGRGIGAARVDGEPQLLGRLVRNLVDNARRHAVTRVDVALTDLGAHVELIVDDDGAGIPESERARVFERFVRLDEARARDAGGSGLGLAIVADVARAHGGAARVETSPLGGARFRVTLPSSAG
ncbi:signal transduction histidine kinase [Diaminobutyricimonas aerilata]|uniref:histidine kinase n=1 Tax=Diaminobutyricimonas aerilata TaxID=1162967 RepID=A0A2M9CLC3_9MICO|nr:HAMP domain-containing sensor histidine kinase [Diaminobutyricimonas aerilata]PJJ72691.1 signal transduction histidine kinase [Diaminobutyricimonas aerilata]